MEATLKYLLVNLLASVFFLLAINRCFAVRGSVSYVALANYYLPLLNAFTPEDAKAILYYPEIYPSALRSLVTGVGLVQTGWWLGLMSLLIAFSLKLGVAPFHLWVPAVYAGGAVPAVGLLATASKIRYVAALSVLMGYVFYPVLACYQWFFVFCALSSVILGNFGLLGQTQLLRILGISSIASSGYLYLILAFAPSIYMYPLAVTYMILSAFLNCNWFLILNTTFVARRSRYPQGLRYISDLASLRYSSGHWGWALALALNVCSLAGIPPLLGFWSKFLTYTTVILSTHGETLGLIYLAVLMVSTLVGAATYLRILAAILFEEPSQIYSYLPPHCGLGVWNLVLLVINVFFAFGGWDRYLSWLTPYYISEVGFMWF